MALQMQFMLPEIKIALTKPVLFWLFEFMGLILDSRPFSAHLKAFSPCTVYCEQWTTSWPFPFRVASVLEVSYVFTKTMFGHQFR
jgi:hypothetical protein